MKYIFYTEDRTNDPVADSYSDELATVEGIPVEKIEEGVEVTIRQVDYKILKVTKGVSKLPENDEYFNVLIEPI